MGLNKEFYSPEFGRYWGVIRELENISKDRETLYSALKEIAEKDENRWREINISKIHDAVENRKSFTRNVRQC